jgi:hypothetical protein
MARYLIGESDERRQKLRDEVLSTTPAHFKAFGDALQTVSDKGIVVALGSQEAVETANAERGNWLKVAKVL